jgi:hypothetical protein
VSQRFGGAVGDYLNIAHVAAQAQRFHVELRRDLRRRLFCTLGIQVPQRDRAADRRQRPRRCEAQAGRSAGYYNARGRPNLGPVSTIIFGSFLLTVFQLPWALSPAGSVRCNLRFLCPVPT